MKFKVNIINTFVLLTVVCSFILTLSFYGNIKNGYELVTVFPLFYGSMFMLTFGQENMKYSNLKITVAMYFMIHWLRFVLMPIAISIAGEDNGTSFLNPQINSIVLATYLMIFDFFISTLYLYYEFKKKEDSVLDTSYSLKGNKLFYVLFIVFAGLIYLYVGRTVDLLNFFVVSLEGGKRVEEITSTPIVIARQIILIAFILIFLFTVNYSEKKYKKTGNQIYFYLAVLAALVNVGIIIGERRSAQVYSAFCTIWILVKAFPHYTKKIILYIGGTAASILLFMSIYKFSNAVAYGSYASAIRNSSFNFEWLSEILQSYFAGPEDLAVITEFARTKQVTFFNLIFDFLRSTVPISFLVKNFGTVTSEYFNYYIYGGLQKTGHVISSVGYGYIYFGFFFTSMFSIFNLASSIFFERKLRLTNSYEMMYLWAYILMRFALNLTANSPTLVTQATIMIMTGGVLFSTARVINNRKGKI